MRRVFSYWFLLSIFFLQASERISLGVPEAAPPSSAVSLSQKNNSCSTSSSSIRSDFDGDGTADLAIGRFDGRRYHVEIQLSGAHSNTLLTSDQLDPGTYLLARDVDLDNDQDIVLVNYTSLLPLAIWLNNGKATFEQADPWSWLNLITSNDGSGVDFDRSSAAPILIVESYRLPFNGSVAGFLARELQCRKSVVQDSQSLNLQFFSSYLSLRGPPPQV